jgi:hypothetical protein
MAQLRLAAESLRQHATAGSMLSQRPRVPDGRLKGVWHGHSMLEGVISLTPFHMAELVYPLVSRELY